MFTLTLPLIVAYSLVVSGTLVWIDKTGRGVFANALVTLAICMAIGMVQLWATRFAPVSLPFFMVWGVFVLAPGAAMLAVCVLPFVRARPWSLMLLGPVSFLLGMIVSAPLVNMLSGSGRSQ